MNAFPWMDAALAFAVIGSVTTAILLDLLAVITWLLGDYSGLPVLDRVLERRYACEGTSHA